MKKEFTHPDDTNTIVTTYRKIRLNSCDMNIGGLIAAPHIPEGWSVEDPASGKTLVVTKTVLAAEAFIHCLQEDVRDGKQWFDCRKWSM